MLNKIPFIIALVFMAVMAGCKAKKTIPEKPAEPQVSEIPTVKQEELPESLIIDEIPGEESAIVPVQIVNNAPFVMREFRAAWIAFRPLTI